ncbi:MAG: acyl carrier protein [Bacillota bacterium]
MEIERVRKLIADQLGMEVEEVTLEKRLIDDLEADSLDIVELMMTFEEEFNVEIPDEEVERLRTVGQVIEYIQAKLGE